MAERSLTPVKAQKDKGPSEGSKEWAQVHRDAIQEKVRFRASNASALMREIEKIRPENPGGAEGGRLPRTNPETGKPWAHLLLGFKSWTDFVETRQQDGGLGWSAAHERSMWLGWRKAKEAGVSPELVDELGQAWLSEVGQNRKGAADSLTAESARTTADEKRERRLNPPEKRKGDQLPAKRKKDDKRPSRDPPPVRTMKATAQEFVANVAPVVDPKSALMVAESVLPRMDPQDLVLVAEEVVTKLESEHVPRILEAMVPMLDAEETWTLARMTTRRLQTEELERLSKEVSELLAARREHEEAERKRLEATQEAASKDAAARRSAKDKATADEGAKKGKRKR